MLYDDELIKCPVCKRKRPPYPELVEGKEVCDGCGDDWHENNPSWEDIKRDIKASS